jgi:hypothetical protein
VTGVTVIGADIERDHAPCPNGWQHRAMPRQFDPHDPESYFDDPRSRKWVVRCVGCRRIGYRSEARAEFFNRYWLEWKFEALDLDDRGLCEACRDALGRSS